MFISSSVDPYVEEFYDNTETISKELEKIGIPSYRIHASGHTTPHDLINFIYEVNPRYLIPIHTKHAKFFEKFFHISEIEVIIAELNKPIKF